MSRNLIASLFLLVLAHPAIALADPSALGVAAGDDVSVDANLTVCRQLTVPKANITSVLQLTPLSNPPANPSPGDIYFTTTDELMIYTSGKWKPIVAVSASHGIKHFTGGSGTWSVPAGIYALTVTLTGGGGGGGPARSHRQERQSYCDAGKRGGNGGVRLGVYMDVTPGQQISFSVGSGGSAGRTSCDPWFGCVYTDSGNGGTTVFGNLSADGGQGGSQTSNGSDEAPSGAYPYGSHGQGGVGGTRCNGISAGAGTSGAIYIQY